MIVELSTAVIASLLLILLTRLWSSSLFVTKDYQGFTTQVFSFDKGSNLNNALFWLLLAPIFSVVVYIAIVYFKLDTDSGLLWLITPTYWVIAMVWIATLGRARLINISFFVFVAIFGTIINYVLARYLFTGDLSSLEPSREDVVAQLWLVVFFFFASILLKLSNDSNYMDRETSYFKAKAGNYLRKYPQIGEVQKDVRSVILAILIKEEFERPAIFRVIEKLVDAKTKNNAQNRSTDDNDSVNKLIAASLRAYDEYVGMPDDGVSYQSLPVHIAKKHNRDESYADEVSMVYFALQRY